MQQSIFLYNLKKAWIIAALAFASAPIIAQAQTKAAAQAELGQPTGTYQIVKATENRVWRLNVQTGEVSVCTLGGANLICTSSSQAMTPPSQSYQDYEAERERAANEQRIKDMQFFDRVVSAARMIFQLEQDSANTTVNEPDETK